MQIHSRPAGGTNVSKTSHSAAILEMPLGHSNSFHLFPGLLTAAAVTH